MKTLRNSMFCLAVFLLASSIISAQDFSKYRGFSLGTSLATVLKQTQQKPVDVKVIHARPTLIQDLNWWPPAVPGASYRADSVEQMLFSFCNGEFSNGEKTVASWEDSQYFFKLVRSPFTNRFGLTIFSKLLNAEAEIIIADAVTLEKQEKPQRDADLKKKEVDDLEAERQKNQKAFRP